MGFCFSPICQEGKTIADKLAKLGLLCSSVNLGSRNRGCPKCLILVDLGFKKSSPVVIAVD